MIYYHGVLVDETGCEFGAGVHASSKEEASQHLRESYPECRLVQLESPDDTAERERAMYARLDAELNGEFYWEDEEDW